MARPAFNSPIAKAYLSYATNLAQQQTLRDFLDAADESAALAAIKFELVPATFPADTIPKTDLATLRPFCCIWKVDNQAAIYEKIATGQNTAGTYSFICHLEEETTDFISKFNTAATTAGEPNIDANMRDEVALAWLNTYDQIFKDSRYRDGGSTHRVQLLYGYRDTRNTSGLGDYVAAAALVSVGYQSGGG